MAQQDIIIGPANQGQGDTLFDAFTKVQSNFDELYADDAGDVNSVTAGTGISVNQTTGAVIVTNSDPDQTVVLTGGTGITTSGTYPNFTITNSDPDQTVSLTGVDIAVSGTYPSFTLTNSAPNYNHTGEVTGATALTITNGAVTNAKMAADSVDSAQYVDGSIDTVHLADDVISYAKLGAEFTTSAALSTNVDFATAQVFTKTLSGATTLTFSNTAIGMVKDLVITGAHTLTLPSGSTVAGTYNGAVSNLIQVVVTGAAEYWFSISQAQ